MKLAPMLYGKHAPQRPIYADQRFLGITLAARLRIFGLLVIAMLVLIIYIVIQQANDRAARKQTVDQRLADARAATRDLACSTVIFLRAQPHIRTNEAFIHFLVGRYACDQAGYHPSTPAIPKVPGAATSSRPRTASHTPGAPDTTAHTGGTPTHTATVTHTTSAPRPSRTATRTATRTTTRTVQPPPPSPSSTGLICTVTPIICNVGK